jgi:hypothetical protein
MFLFPAHHLPLPHHLSLTLPNHLSLRLTFVVLALLPRPVLNPDDDPVANTCANNDDSHVVFNQGYHLRDRVTIAAPERYGFPHAGAVIAEPLSYKEASGIPEWQLAMTDELNAFIAHVHGMFRYLLVLYLSRANGSSRLKPNLMGLLSDIKLVLWPEVFNRLRVLTMMRLLHLWPI